MTTSVRQRLMHWIEKRTFLRAVSILAGGTAVSQALALLLTPVLTRLYPVAQFGYFQIYMSVLTAGLTIAALRYELAILLPTEDEMAINVRSVALFCVVLTSGAAATAVALIKLLGFAPRIAGTFAPWLWSLPVGILAAGFLQVETYWALRRKTFRIVAQSKITQVGTQLSVQTGSGIALPTPSGLMVGDIAGRIISGLVLVVSDWRRNGSTWWSKVRWSKMTAVATRYKKFPLISSASGLLNTAGFTLTPLLIGSFYGVHVLGLFSVVERIMGAPALLVGQAISQVYLAEGGRLVNSAPQALEGLFKRTFQKLLMFSLIPAILIAIFAPYLFSKVLGAQWHEAGIYARLLVGRQIIAFALWPLSQTLLILEQQRVQFFWDIGRAILTLGTVALCWKLGLSARMSIFWYGMAMVVGYVAYWATCRQMLRLRTTQYLAANPLTTVSQTAGGGGV